MQNINNILCVLPKYSFGSKSRGISPEYNAIFLPLKKKNFKLTFFDSLKHKNIKKINLNLIKIVENLKPQLVFFAISSYEIYIETLIKIKLISNPIMINWSSDDDAWRFDQHSKILSDYFDCMVTTSREAHKIYKKINRFSILLSHWGCPDHWIKKPIRAQKCKYEVSFVGKSYFDRKELINYLLNQNINVKCFGYGWNSKVLKNNELPKVFQNSKISLNFSSTKNSKKQLKARVFEVTGSGGFLITENSPNLNKFFTKKEILVFRNKLELLKCIKKIISNNKLRDNMVKNSSKKSMNYSSSSIINNILKTVISKKFKKNFFISKKFRKISKIEIILLKTYKFLSILLLSLIFDKNKSKKASRRFLFEIEWRIRKENTYSKNGWCVNLFNIF